MDAKRIFLYAAIFLTTLSLWTAWQQEHPYKPNIKSPSPSLVSSNTPAPASTANVVENLQKKQPSIAVPAQRRITIKNDVLALTLDSQDAKFISAKLLKFQKELHGENDPFVLFNDNPQTLYTAENGIVGNGASKKQTIQFYTDKKSYQLQDSQKQISVVLKGQTSDGLSVTKTIRLDKGSYIIHIENAIENRNAKTYNGHMYSQISRTKPADSDSSGIFSIASYTGASISDPNKKLFEKVSFKDMQKQNLSRAVKGGWVAMQQHYFLTAWVPKVVQDNQQYSQVNNDVYTIGMMSPSLAITAGQKVNYNSQLYVGPEETAILKTLAPGLELTIDYGMLWFLSAPLFWLMKQIYLLIGNWGWSIILITVLIKLAFYRLSAASYVSMANMRKLQPRILAIRERYKDDKQKLSQATMDLYKKEKINPLGGCLPILVQIPVFIALYWVLLESVELRHAPFMFWIHDLAARDPYYILPVIMGLSMLIQQKLNPPPPDPMQAKVMLMLPVLFTFLFLNFPSGLVLYWVVNNVLSILQQWYITQKIEAQAK